MEEKHYWDCKLAINETNCPIYKRPDLVEPFKKEMGHHPTAKAREQYPLLFLMDSETVKKCLNVCGPCDNYRGCHRGCQ